MINEIIKTNKIEGVVSTKKDISESMNTKKARFSGIVNKYKEITEGNLEKINSVEEIRKIYDDIFKEDILKNPENELDGKLFRKKPSVYPRWHKKNSFRSIIRRYYYFTAQ